jgi:hypothetical protein
MPYYIYTCKAGHESEYFSSLDRYKRFRKCKCPECGKRAEHTIAATTKNFKHSAGTWPMHSEAMAVLPSQVREQQAVLARSGIQCDFDGEGRPILTSRQHRKQVAEAMGLYDRNGGYGDPQRLNRSNENDNANDLGSFGLE